MLPRPIMSAVTVLVSLAWAANVIFGFAEPGRNDPTINAIFGIVVGGVYALQQRSSVTSKPPVDNNDTDDAHEETKP